MAIFKQFHLTWLTGMFVIALNTLFFVVYFSLLGMPITIMSIAYVVVGSLSYFILAHVARWYSWQIACHVLLGVVYLWAIVNFAYYHVFGVFLDFSLTTVTQGTSMLGLLKDFTHLIPGKLWFLAGVLYSGIILNMLWYNRMQRHDISEVNFGQTTLTVEQQRKKRRLWVIAIWLLSFAGINAAAVSATAQLLNNPKDTWWDVKQEAADLGVFGKLYARSAQTLQSEQPIFSTLPLMRQTKQLYADVAFFEPPRISSFDRPTFETKPNILIVQLESFPMWAVNHDPTPVPFLKSLMRQGLTAGQFYSNGCETVNAEFAGLCSFWPESQDPVAYHPDKQFDCLPNILKKEHGYGTYVFHANEPAFWSRDQLDPKWGFEHLVMTPEFKQKASDAVVFEAAVEQLAAAPKPFFGYVISFTSHAPHNQEQVDFQKERGNVITPFESPLNAQYGTIEIAEDEAQLYMGFLRNTDEALKSMFAKLEEKKLSDSTIVVLYGDHRYYKFLGDSIDDFHHYNDLPFVMLVPQKLQGMIQPVASQVDVAPTLLQLVEGDLYLPRSQFVGTSLFDTRFPNTAVNKCLNQAYAVTPSMVIEGNSKTEQYHFRTAAALSEEKKKTLLDMVRHLIAASDRALQEDSLLVK